MERIKELEEEMKNYNKLAEEMENDIRNMEYEVSRLYDRRDMAEREISKIKEEKQEERISDIRRQQFQLDGDKFTNSLKRASLFCSTDNKGLSTIKLYEDKVVATSGYTGIIIDVEVPIDKQNIEMSWDLKKETVLTEGHLQTVRNAYEAGKKGSIKEVVVKKKNVFKELNPEIRKIDDECTVYIFSYENIELAISTRYLDDALMVFNDEDEILFTFPSSRIRVLLMENKTQKLIVMPIRLSE